MTNRMSYADALMRVGGGFPRQPGTARDDLQNARAGTPNGGTPEGMAQQLLQVAPQAAESAVRGSLAPSVSDGGRSGMADPRHAQPPQGVPSDARAARRSAGANPGADDCRTGSGSGRGGVPIALAAHGVRRWRAANGPMHC
jgi:hypothetical protein